MDNSKGFTLLELIITIAIVGVLASIALPSYTLYMGRAKVAAALSELTTLKSNYEVALASSIEMPGLSDIGADVINSNQCVFSISGQAANGAGAIICTFKAVPTLLAGGIISVVRDSAGTWTCTANSSINSSFLPQGCSSSS